MRPIRFFRIGRDLYIMEKRPLGRTGEISRGRTVNTRTDADGRSSKDGQTRWMDPFDNLKWRNV